jgi:hypothetical protein
LTSPCFAIKKQRDLFSRPSQNKFQHTSPLKTAPSRFYFAIFLSIFLIFLF